MKPKKKILIIDDEGEILEFISVRLEAQNFECLTAETAIEGLTMATQSKPDLVLLDLNLPKMSGFGFLREIKGDPKLSDIPVVVFTAVGNEDVAREAMELGASGFLVKTCNARELTSMVQEYIE